MEQVIKGIFKWFNLNKLILNIDKTNFSISHTKNRKIPSECDSLNLDNKIIEKVDSVKYLGVYLDDKLNWNCHVNHLMEYLVRFTSSFKLIRHYLADSCKTKLYYAYVHSKIIYGLEVFGHTTKLNI